MPDLEKFVKNVMYGGIGAAASLVEKGGDLARSLVEKGQETVRNSQDTADDIKRRLQEFCDGLMKRGEIDISKLTPEQRAELRHQLEEMDYQEIWARKRPKRLTHRLRKRLKRRKPPKPRLTPNPRKSRKRRRKPNPPKRTSPNCRMMPSRLAANRTTTHNKPQTALSVTRQGGLSLYLDKHADTVCSCHQLNRAEGSREGTSSRFILPCGVQRQRR